MMRWWRGWFVVVTLSAIAPAILAAEQGRGPHDHRPTYSDIDLNGNGRVEEAEFYEARANRIRERTAEGRELKNLSRAPKFADIDTDGNGSISESEFANHQMRRTAAKEKRQH